MLEEELLEAWLRLTCVIDNQRLGVSPEEVREGGHRTLYIGFYLPELELIMVDELDCILGYAMFSRFHTTLQLYK